MKDEFYYSTDTEWDNEEARQIGEVNSHRAWVCTDRDVIHANPFYQGPPVPHPDWEGTDEEWFASEARRKAREASLESGYQDWEIVPDEIPF